MSGFPPTHWKPGHTLQPYSDTPLRCTCIPNANSLRRLPHRVSVQIVNTIAHCSQIPPSMTMDNWYTDLACRHNLLMFRSWNCHLPLFVVLTGCLCDRMYRYYFQFDYHLYQTMFQ